MRATDTERKLIFRKSSIEDQYELMQLGNSLVHPPMMELITEFAHRGPAVVPVLVAALDRNPDSVELRNIAHALLELDRAGLYNVSSDSGLMAKLDRKVLADTGIWATSTREIVAEIRATN